MHAYVQIKDEKGDLFEGSVELVPVKEGHKKDKESVQNGRPHVEIAMSFNFKLNPRAFMKKYGQQLTGSKKFTLLLAKLAAGKVGVEVSHDLVKSTWNRMKPIMGGPYNRAYPVRAKDQGWIDSPKRGVFVLAVGWKAAAKGD